MTRDERFETEALPHLRPLYRTAYRMTRNPADAEDLVQETFLRAYRALERFDARAAFTTWIHRIAINCSLDLIDSRKRRDAKHDDEALAAIASTAATPDRIVHGLEMQRAVATAMERLSGNERTAFVLRHFEGMPLEEIGQVLGTQINATKNTVFRAVKKLREQLQPFTGSLI